MAIKNKFYVNFETEDTISTANDLCNRIDCDECPVRNQNSCLQKLEENLEDCAKKFGYTPWSFDALKSAKNAGVGAVVVGDAKLVRFHDVPTRIYGITNAQYEVLETLRGEGVIDFDDAEIINL